MTSRVRCSSKAGASVKTKMAENQSTSSIALRIPCIASSGQSPPPKARSSRNMERKPCAPATSALNRLADGTTAIRL